MSEQKMIESLLNLDPQAVLAPFMEANATAFFHAQGSLEIPSFEQLEAWSEQAGLNTVSCQAVTNLAGRVLADETTSFLLFHCIRLAFDFPAALYPGAKILQWPGSDHGRAGSPLHPGRSV